MSRTWLGLASFGALVLVSIVIGSWGLSLAGLDLARVTILSALLGFSNSFLLAAIAFELIVTTDGFRRRTPRPPYTGHMVAIGLGFLGLTAAALVFGHVLYEQIWAPMSRDQRFRIASTMHMLQIGITGAGMGALIVGLMLRRRPARRSQSDIEVSNG